MVTSREVYQAVLAELKHYNTTSMTPDEFNYHIWAGELEYVKNRYWAHDQHQKAIDDLDVIKIVTDGIAGMPIPLVNEGADVAGQEYITLPDDYLYMLAVAVKVKYQNVDCEEDGDISPYTAATHLKDDKRFVVNDDYYSRPQAIWSNIYYNHRSNVLTFYAGESIVQEVQLVYLRKPVRIVFDPTGQNNVDSEFAWPQVLEIVKHTVISYLETISSPRVQTMAAVDARNFNQFPPPNVPT